MLGAYSIYGIPPLGIFKFNKLIINIVQITYYMGEKSSVTINTPGKSSLKTTILISMVRQFRIRQGDQLDWSVTKMGENELVIVVGKEDQKLEQIILLYSFTDNERQKTYSGYGRKSTKNKK